MVLVRGDSPSNEASFTMYANTQVNVVPQDATEGSIRRFTRYASMPIKIVPQHGMDHSILKRLTPYASYNEGFHTVHERGVCT